MTKIFTFLVALSIFAVSCKKDDSPQPEPVVQTDIVTYANAKVTSAQEFPTNNSAASGAVTVKYDKISNNLSYTITYSGITPTVMHFHKGAVGVSGGVAMEVPAPYSSGMTGTIKLTDAQEIDLLAGLWYLNIHSAAFAGGEIRGQIVPENIVVLSNVAINGKQEVPLNASTATGVFNGTYDKTTKKVTYTIALNGLTAPVLHLHKGAAGVSGAVVVELSAAGGTTAAITAQDEIDLLAGNIYVNVHTTSFGGGEIRGQILPSNQVIFASAIKPENEFPVVVSTASGSVYAVYDRSTKTLSYTINYVTVIPTAMHFHKGAVGASGGVELGITAPFSNGMKGSGTLTATQEADLLAGLWYLNIHSAAFGSGELRAQLVK